MSASRPQGRPRRGPAEVGRDKIVNRLLGVVRSGVDIDLSRKTLSAHAGVTPALISYYFPKKEMLLEEIAEPVIRKYRIEMETIIKSDLGRDEKLREVVTLLVNLYTVDGRIYDIYTDIVRRPRQTGTSEIAVMTEMLVQFFSSWDGRLREGRFDATVLQGAVWGMCRFAARVEAEINGSTIDVGPIVTKMVNIIALSLSGDRRPEFV